MPLLVPLPTVTPMLGVPGDGMLPVTSSAAARLLPNSPPPVITHTAHGKPEVAPVLSAVADWHGRIEDILMTWANVVFTVEQIITLISLAGVVPSAGVTGNGAPVYGVT